MVEIKAISQLEDIHLVQTISYLEAYGVPLGLLINFGAPSLQFKCVYNNHLIRRQANQGVMSQFSKRLFEKGWSSVLRCLNGEA